MKYILFDENREDFLPFTFTRPVADIRFGILTIREKWEKYLKTNTLSLTADFLQEKFPGLAASERETTWINGSICPNKEIIKEIAGLKESSALIAGGFIIAFRSSDKVTLSDVSDFKKLGLNERQINHSFLKINHPWDIFSKNGEAIKADFELLTSGRTSAPISDTNKVLNPSAIFLEEGAKVECAILNASEGPIYIGRDAEVMEGSIIRGPFALCEHSATKLGAKIYGPTTIGPYSKVGGEINNSVIFGYSNKAHDGFLGNSVLGEWCNLGADTNNSNLKNNYSLVKIYNYNKKDYINTGLQFCGLLMGDHSKSGINTMFNTGTVVGVSANIFGSDFPPKYIPSFSWGGAAGFEKFKLDKALEVAENVFKRRGKVLDETEKKLFQNLYKEV